MRSLNTIEFFRNYTKSAMLGVKGYIGDSKRGIPAKNYLQ